MNSSQSNASDANVSSIPLTESSSSAPSKMPLEDSAQVVQVAEDPAAEMAAEENVAAVFVVRFDVIHGNTIEWQHPTELDLSGVEYQAICSGHHRVSSDTTYFAKPPYFGVSVFRKVDTDGTQRGASMRAVGVMVEPTGDTGPSAKVWTHGHALNVFARNHDFESEEDERLYKGLLRYFEKHRLQHRQASQKLWDPSPSALNTFRPSTLMYYNYGQHPPFARIFEQLVAVEPRPPLETVPHLDAFPFFVAQFGPQIFVLWKAALLKKRILYTTAPPLERACSYVYNTFLLGAVPNASIFKSRKRLHPKYAIGVNDIADLYDFGEGFVACTSDTIFSSKTDLYDLLIDLPSAAPSQDGTGARKEHQNTRSWYPFHTPRIESTSEVSARHNAADFHRFRSAVRQIFDTARDLGFGQNDGELNRQLGDALERKADCRDALGTAFFQMILWWYRPAPQPQKSQPATSSSWQRIFAGDVSSAARRRARQKRLQDVPMDPEEQEALLLGDGDDLADEERDATEINNNEVFSVVAARASEEQLRRDQIMLDGSATRKWGVHEKLTAALVGFFHTLSYQTLLTLDSLLSMNDYNGDSSDPIVLSPHDMIQLDGAGGNCLPESQHMLRLFQQKR
ncbi:hypothetical protein BJV82DRAFT_670699 [Fennellomyces sp. T-0311]|nr:hypothetical protein BJV82DRAFT_670699 [Fennellomyces sp. T-0311]